MYYLFFFFFQAEDGIRDRDVTGVQTCALPISDIIGRSLVRSIALKADLGFYEGSGTAPEIRGLKNVSGTQSETSLGANGLTPTNFDQVAAAIGLLEAANANPGAIVMHPRTWGTMLKFKASSGGT